VHFPRSWNTSAFFVYANGFESRHVSEQRWCCFYCFEYSYDVQPLGKKLVQVDAKAVETKQAIRARHSTLLKFQESAWKFVAYTCLTIISWRALRHEVFWKDIHQFWTECSRIPCDYNTPPAMNLAYAADMAYYTYAIPYCIFFETKRKDFWATFLHHVITVVLIAYSFCLGFTKIGVVIMFLHDVCDPWLEMAKLTKYAGCELATNVLFVIFTITWIVMRVVYFPLWVIHSAVFDGYDTVMRSSGSTAASFPHATLLGGMLIILWLLHVFWTYVILRIAVAAVTQGSPDDDREKED
jgi:hypothetical protein